MARTSTSGMDTWQPGATADQAQKWTVQTGTTAGAGPPAGQQNPVPLSLISTDAAAWRWLASNFTASCASMCHTMHGVLHEPSWQYMWTCQAIQLS